MLKRLMLVLLFLVMATPGFAEYKTEYKYVSKQYVDVLQPLIDSKKISLSQAFDAISKLSYDKGYKDAVSQINAQKPSFGQSLGQGLINATAVLNSPKPNSYTYKDQYGNVVGTATQN